MNVKEYSKYTAVRTVLKSVSPGKIQLVSCIGRDEIFTRKEIFQSYGVCSRPLPGSEGILLFVGGVDNAIVIATEDRRYRVALESGEVALYTDEGDFIHLKRNKEIYIKSGNKLKADIENDVEINTKRIKFNASESLDIQSPEVNINASTSLNIQSPDISLQGPVEIIGDVAVTGDITATGDIQAHTP